MTSRWMMKRFVVSFFVGGLMALALPLRGGAPSSVANAPLVGAGSGADSSEPRRSDPVGVVSGNAYEAETDVAVDCPGLGLALRRAYVSRSRRCGTLGAGWSHAYEWSVAVSGGRVTLLALAGAGEEMDFPDPPAGGRTLGRNGWALERTGGGLEAVAPDGTRYAFDGEGRLASVLAWDGTCVRLERGGPGGAVSRAVHANGDALAFEYSDDGLLVRVTTPDPAVWAEYGYGRSGGVPVLVRAAVHDGPRVAESRYAYGPEPPAPVRPASPGNGGAVVVAGTPPAAGSRLPRAPAGAVGALSLAAAPAGAAGRWPLLVRREGADGSSAEYAYARVGDGPEVRAVRASAGGGRLLAEFSYRADRSGRRGVAVSGPSAGGTFLEEFACDALGRVTGWSRGGESLAREYGADGTVRETAWGASGWTLERLEARDALGRTLSATARLAPPGMAPGAFPAPARAEWDARRGVPRRTVSPAGRVWERVEAADGLSAVVYGAGAGDPRLVTRIAFAAPGRPSSVAAPGGGTLRIAYGPDGRPSRIEPEGLPAADLAWDALGRLASVTLPGPGGTARTVRWERNARGLPVRTEWPDGTVETVAYDGGGRRAVRRTDALGREALLAWELGRLLRASLASGGTTNLLAAADYDAQMGATAVRDPLGRLAESYAYDGSGRVAAVTNLEGRVATRSYLLGGLVASETRPDGTAVAYGYDAAGRLASAAYPGGEIRLAWDADGLLLAASGGAGAVSNAWDAATGWLDATAGADGTRVAFGRSDGGAVTSVTSVAGTVRHALDAAGRRTRTDSPAGAVAYAHCPWNGLVSSVALPGGVTASYAYDVMDRVTNVAWRTAAGERLGGLSYAYDAIGRVVSRRHDLGGTRFDRDYAYDAADRLASDGDISYAYDAAGNRLSRTGGGGAVAYAYGPGDRLAAWTGGSYGHDAAGCVTRIVRGGVSMDLEWDGLYRLVSVATNGVPAESYAYDALGRRVATTAAEGTERHVYDDRWQVIADLDADGRVVRSYVWGEGVDRLLAVRIGARTYAALADMQGTVWGFADGGGRIAARWTYDAWGNVLSEEIAEGAGELRAVRYRFQGRELSAATGLVHFRTRWYDPVTGRWLSPDPIGLEGGLNLYCFCGNDGINNSDYDGCGKIKIVVRTVKWIRKYVSRESAKNILRNGGTVTIIGKGAGKKAKRLCEEVSDKRIVRHDPHRPGQYPHYQPKSGGFHVNVPGAHLGVFFFGDNLLGDLFDFFNPLSDAQDIVDILSDLFGENE